MLDIRLIRENVEEAIKKLSTRNGDFSYLRDVVKLDEDRRKVLNEVEELKNFRNQKSKEIGINKRQGLDVAPIMEEVANIGEKIKVLDDKVREIEGKINELMAITPNIPNESLPVGKDEDANELIRTWGEVRKFDFEVLPHWEIGTNLDILDFERAGKITGSRFTVYKGLGARLERAVINLMLDIHTEKHGCKEILPPFMINANSLFGTGQLPKFEQDLFKLREFDYYLAPTAEVPVTNLHANEILSNDELPIKYVAYTPCFRSEAGAAGRDTRGIIRQHQFNKVELVRFTRPEDSYQNLEELTNDAEEILKILKLPYRVMKLSTGDVGFSSAMTYDLEVWLPSYNSYKEISSCSNFEDFQARRANIKFRRDPKAKPEFVHTLNGSGLAVGRTVAAILENYQNEDGSVTVPEALVKYMGTDIIK
ncbi:TPA: serine--tRNA ligase [bacterium]|nr:serine--tRNA ligase [bacterium]